MRLIVGWLSDKDHERYVRSYARAMLALGGHPGLSPVEAEEAIVDDLYLFGELRQKYGVDEAETINFSLSDGAIVEELD